MIIRPEILMHYREAWSRAVTENPEAGRTAIRRKIFTVHMWLYCHDKEWLVANLPPLMKGTGGTPIDWEKRDAETATAIKKAAAEIINMAGCPIRVTVTAISARLRMHIGFNNHLRRLPLSMKATNEVVESYEDFVIRKVMWAADTYQHEGIKPRYTQFRSRIRIDDSKAKIPRIKDAIDRAMHEITENPNRRKPSE